MVRSNVPWWVHGEGTAVDYAKGVITFHLIHWLKAQEVPITNQFPRWLLYPGVEFQTSIPGRCEENETLEGVEWGPFICSGMELRTIEETLWLIGQLHEHPSDRHMADVHEEVVDVCLHFLEKLLRAIAGYSPIMALISWVNTAPLRLDSSLGARLNAIESILRICFSLLAQQQPDQSTWYNRCFTSLKGERRDGIVNEQMRLNQVVERFLECEAACVVLARVTMECTPEKADALYHVLCSYQKSVPSPLASEISTRQGKSLYTKGHPQ